MTKQEYASYLAAIIVIMNSKEAAGQPRGGWLAEEYTRIYDEFQNVIAKEREDEARRSEAKLRAKDGTENAERERASRLGYGISSANDEVVHGSSSAGAEG